MSGLAERSVVNPPVWRNAVILAVMAAICSGLVAMTYVATREQIVANELTYLEQSLQPALAGVIYDNDLTASTLTLRPPHGLPGGAPAVVYRASAGDEPTAALFVVSADGGFVGPIKLMIGIDTEGAITGVRTITHRETPGIGDRIDASKSDWILKFAGLTLDDPERSVWKIRRDGGEIDQISGASITSRAVVNAVRDTLLYFEANRDALFAAPGDATTVQTDD